MNIRRKRADQLLVEAGLCKSRQKAQQLIAEGSVYANGQLVRKSGQQLDLDTQWKLITPHKQWVSRAGYKLQHAFEQFELGDISGQICADIGASTGGFTDVLLHYGAAKIYAVDVGTDQLAPHLVSEPKVINLQQLNVKALTKSHIPEVLDLVVSDVSFISISKALVKPLELVRKGGQVVCLIKPQFEVGRAHIGKKGIVKSEAAHQLAIQNIRDFFYHLACWKIMDVCPSPIKGAGGNVEFLLHAVKTGHSKID